MSDDERSVDLAPSSKKAKVDVVGPAAPIAKPMAGKKLHKRVYKVVKKAAGSKVLKRGVKEVVKAIRKGDAGLCVIAGDICPIDVISHLPVMCEDASIPYVYVSSKAELGAASSTKRPTSCVLVSTKGKGFSGEDKLKEVVDEIKTLDAPKIY